MCSRDETSQSIHCETFRLSTKSQTSLHYVITHILDRLLVPEMVTPQSSYGLRGHSEPEKGFGLLDKSTLWNCVEISIPPHEP
jgi:hypothetical protein